MIFRFLIGCLAVLTSDIFASQMLIELSIPVGCEMGKACYIQNYVDRNSGKEITDYQCRSTSYNGHKGTDFRLNNFVLLKKGINVLAAANGVVTSFRDRVDDWDPIQGYAGFPKGKECGNGVVIDHGQGWVTQYCHMKKGSIKVTTGQSVTTGEVLGQVGLSGKTEFPHLHLSLRINGRVVDPFDYRPTPQEANGACKNTNHQSLWKPEIQPLIPYQDMAITSHGVHSSVPTPLEARLGYYDQKYLDAKATAIVLWLDAIVVTKGALIQGILQFPNKEKRTFQHTLTKSKAQWFQYFGVKRKAKYWPKGVYNYALRLTFKGKVINIKGGQFTVK